MDNRMSGEGAVRGRMIKILASLSLLLVTVIWGSAFVVMKSSLDCISPSYLLACRFTLAALALLIIFRKRISRMTASEFRYGALAGVLLFVSYYFQTYGLKYTTASKNAFITTLYVIIVPFLHWLISRIRPSKYSMAAALIAVAGLALLSLEGDLTVSYGDFLTLICSIGFALHLICLDRYTASSDPIRLTVMQMAAAALCSWATAVLTEGSFPVSVLSDRGVLVSVLYLGLASSMLCFLLQTLGQKYLSAATSSILLSFESVFGLVFSVIFLQEALTGRMLLGCTLMFFAALCAECAPSGKGGDSGQGKKKQEKENKEKAGSEWQKHFT